MNKSLILLSSLVLLLSACNKGAKKDQDATDIDFYAMSESALTNSYELDFSFEKGKVVNNNQVADVKFIGDIRYDGSNHYEFRNTDVNDVLEDKESTLYVLEDVWYYHVLYTYDQSDDGVLLNMANDVNARRLLDLIFGFRTIFDDFNANLDFISHKDNEYTLQVDYQEYHYAVDIKATIEDDFIKEVDYLVNDYENNIYTKHNFVVKDLNNVSFDVPQVKAEELQAYYQNYQNELATFVNVMTIQYNVMISPKNGKDPLILSTSLDYDMKNNIYHFIGEGEEEYYSFENEKTVRYYQNEDKWVKKVDADDDYELNIVPIINMSSTLLNGSSHAFLNAIDESLTVAEDGLSLNYQVKKDDTLFETSLLFNFEAAASLSSINASGETKITMAEESIDCDYNLSLSFEYNQIESLTLPEVEE